MNPIINELEKAYLKEDLPQLNSGDTVKVFVRIVEGNKQLPLEKYSRALALNVYS